MKIDKSQFVLEVMPGFVSFAHREGCYLAIYADQECTYFDYVQQDIVKSRVSIDASSEEILNWNSLTYYFCLLHTAAEHQKQLSTDYVDKLIEKIPE